MTDLKLHDIVIMRNQGGLQELITYYQHPKFPKIITHFPSPLGSYNAMCLFKFKDKRQGKENQLISSKDVVILTPLFRFHDETS